MVKRRFFQVIIAGTYCMLYVWTCVAGLVCVRIRDKRCSVYTNNITQVRYQILNYIFCCRVTENRSLKLLTFLPLDQKKKIVDAPMKEKIKVYPFQKNFLQTLVEIFFKYKNCFKEFGTTLQTKWKFHIWGVGYQNRVKRVCGVYFWKYSRMKIFKKFKFLEKKKY